VKANRHVALNRAVPCEVGGANAMRERGLNDKTMGDVFVQRLTSRATLLSLSQCIQKGTSRLCLTTTLQT
jgi:hypothetical protein